MDDFIRLTTSDIKIKYYLKEVNQHIIFSILYQAEVERGEVSNYFTAKNGWSILSDAEPYINIENKIVYIRGRNKEADNKISVTSLINEGQYTPVDLNEIEQALNEWASDYKEFNVDKIAVKLD